MSTNGITLSASGAGSLFGMNYGVDDYADPLALACNALGSAADEIEVMRHAVGSDELDADKLDLVLFRLAERMRTAADLAWAKHRAERPAPAAEGPQVTP